MNWPLIFLGILALPAVALAQVDERDGTERAYSDCLERVASQIDDQKSDVAAIANAIIPLCASEYAAQKTAFGRFTSDPAAQRALFDAMDAARVQTATSVVLRERLGHASR